MKTARLLACGSLWSLILAFPSAQAMAADGWGSSYSFGPTTSRIIYAKTTLVPGRLPPITSTTGPLFLWPGMSNPTSDLIQTTMDAWGDNKGYCGAATGQWCVEASVFGSFGQRNGPTVAIDPDDHVTIEYKLGADGNTWTQTVTSQKLGKVVSTLQSASGPMPKGGFGFATEADADSFTIDTQYYLCTELHFAEADPHFASTGVGGTGAKYGATGTGSGIGTAKNVHTPDNGLTWLVDLITLPAMNPQGTQTPPPTYSCSGSSSSSSSSSSNSSSSNSSGAHSSSGGGSSSSSSAHSSSGTTSSGAASNSGAHSSDKASSSSSSGNASSRGSSSTQTSNSGTTSSGVAGGGGGGAGGGSDGSGSSGCGCVTGASRQPHMWFAALTLMAAALYRRRRRDA